MHIDVGNEVGSYFVSESGKSDTSGSSVIVWLIFKSRCFSSKNLRRRRCKLHDCKERSLQQLVAPLKLRQLINGRNTSRAGSPLSSENVSRCSRSNLKSQSLPGANDQRIGMRPYLRSNSTWIFDEKHYDLNISQTTIERRDYQATLPQGRKAAGGCKPRHGHGDWKQERSFSGLRAILRDAGVYVARCLY